VLALRCSTEADYSDVLKQPQDLKKEQSCNHDTLRDSISLLVDVVHPHAGVDLNNLVQQCLNGINDLKQKLPQTRESEMLYWLSFRQMSFRHEEIPATYQQTFSWIFAKPSVVNSWDDFRMYLQQNIAVPFFINGKAGSGKSTLMKYIVGHQETKRLLNVWAASDQKKLFITEHFFWRLGTPLQRTTTGLLRTLLFKVLQEYPELIPVVFPIQYQSFTRETSEDPPNETETKTAWRLPLEKSESFLRLAVFIDGVDEFGGDHSSLTGFIRDLASDQVKIIVSSRPINAALNAFRHCPSLRLQDLTRNDMVQYIHGNLKAHSIMMQMARYHPQVSQSIFKELLEKSEGVFLWVSLVVKLLVDGLEAGDAIEDLQIKLRALPSDLRALYRRMMADIPPELNLASIQLSFFSASKLGVPNPTENLKPLRCISLLGHHRKV
jgi:hypothetical protein